MKKQLLLTLMLFASHLLSAQCISPLALTVSSITNTTATLSWTSQGSASEWAIFIQPSGSPAPSPGEQGIMTMTNPYVVTGLVCGNDYAFYVRTVCSQTEGSGWAGPYNFSMPCAPQAGFPNNLAQCSDTSNACFDLTQNDSAVLGSLNPSEYTVSYFASQGDAANNVNPIANATNYCITQPGPASTVMFVRLEQNSTGSFQILNFALTVQHVIAGNVLQPLIQCDEDGNGFVTFDLTAAAAQINTSNPLSYYANFADATSDTGVNAIPDPQAYTVQAGSSQVYTTFVREHVVGGCDIVYSFPINPLNNCNLASVCGAANSLCGSLGIPFSNTTNVSNAEAGNNYECLMTQPNPTWFYIPISQAGSIGFSIAQANASGNGLDVDFICYGPFANPTTPCNGLLTTQNVIACSYSTATVENFVIPNAIPGQFYLLMVTNFSNQSGEITINQTSGTGAIDCTGMNFTAFLDTNGNGLKDAAEPNFPLGEFHFTKNNGTQHNITSPTGSYAIYDTTNSNFYDVSFSVDPSYSLNFIVTTSSYTGLSVEPGSGLTNYYFPVTALQNYTDLSISIIPLDQRRPGFMCTSLIKYTNMGTLTASGTVSFVHDPLLTISNVSQIGTIPNSNGFTYNFANLLPFESREFSVAMMVPPIPTVAIGQLLTDSANIGPLTGDSHPENNNFSSSQIVVGSYDPNDKMESHGERIVFADFNANDYLYYTIRFENTGTAAANNVRILDVLDNALDATSVRMLDASHDYILDRIGNQLTWQFDDIHLPFASADPQGAKGYVQFKVKLKPGFAIGDIIPNTASIFFDFNPAIVTNTFHTEFVENLRNPLFSDNDMVMYPNPAGDIVTVALTQGATISQVAVYDMLGKQVVAKKSNANVETLDISAISSGIYLLEIINTEGQKAIKKLSIK